VNDAQAYLDFGHNEERNGYATSGTYHVVLPDGRTQTVSYKADENGYVADVQYQGEAQYPKYEPKQYKAAAPAYEPAAAPAYQPAPAAPAYPSL
jgi:hypothetical protein